MNTHVQGEQIPSTINLPLTSYINVDGDKLPDTDEGVATRRRYKHVSDKFSKLLKRKGAIEPAFDDTKVVQMAFESKTLLSGRLNEQEYQNFADFLEFITGKSQRIDELRQPILALFGWVHLGYGGFTGKLRTLQSQLGAGMVFQPERRILGEAGFKLFEEFPFKGRPIFVPIGASDPRFIGSFAEKTITMATYAFIGYGRGRRGARSRANDDVDEGDAHTKFDDVDYGEGEFGFATIIDSKDAAIACGRPANPDTGDPGMRLPWPTNAISGQYQYLYAHGFSDDSIDERSCTVEAARLAALLEIKDVLYMSRADRVWRHYQDDDMRFVDDDMNTIDVNDYEMQYNTPVP